MTNEKASDLLDNLIGMVDDKDDSEYDIALKMGIKALENIGHLKDRPCSVCEFRKENGCCKWDCVFD